MSIDISLVFNSISTAGLLVASIFTIKNYYLIKNSENENHFYRYKMNNAQNLIVAAMNLIDEFQNVVSESSDLKEQNKFDEVANKKNDEKIDFYFDKFRKSVIENSLFLPEIIVVKIESFYDMFLVDKVFTGAEDEIEKYFDELLEEIEAIIDLIREDLGIENLNKKLKTKM